jgi:hypothetical protein
MAVGVLRVMSALFAEKRKRFGLPPGRISIALANQRMLRPIPLTEFPESQRSD